MFPKLFEYDGFFLPTYGVLVTIGFLVGLWLTGRLARERGMDPQRVTDLGIYVALAGLAGAKLLMFLYDLDYYRKNPGEIFTFSTLQAGGVFYGGLIAALLTAWWYLRRHNLPFLATADVFAPGIAMGHAIGRIGCFAAGCCWGAQCDRPWAVTFTDPAAHELVGVPLDIKLHPSQIYEAIAELLIFSFLFWRIQRPHAKGVVIGLYLVMYSLARFVVEFFRNHEQANPFGWILSNGQWIALLLMAVGVALLAVSREEQEQKA